MNKFILPIAAVSFAIVGCGERATTDSQVGSTDNGATAGQAQSTAMNQGQTTQAGTTGMMADGAAGPDANTPEAYLAAAASGDQFEIQSSEFVLQQTQNAKVKEFAQQMVTDHRASTAKLMTASQQASLSAPAETMMAKHQSQMTALREAGANIDQVYMGQQRDAHREAIALHQSQAGNSKAPAPLSAFAAEVLPRVQGHAKMLDTIKI